MSARTVVSLNSVLFALWDRSDVDETWRWHKGSRWLKVCSTLRRVYSKHRKVPVNTSGRRWHKDTHTHTPNIRGLSWEPSSFSSAASEMRKRLLQIFGFLLTSLGWLFVLCTMAMDYWRITQIGGQGGSFIIKVAWYWSNLWKDCFTDSTAVTNCKDFPVLWTVTRKNLAYLSTVNDRVLCVCVCVYKQLILLEKPSCHVFSVKRPCCDPAALIQRVRGLLMCGITLGFFAVVLCFIGMECTYIGGADKIKDKLVFAGAVFHFVGGECGSCPWQKINQHVLLSFSSLYRWCLVTQVYPILPATVCTSTGLPRQPLPQVLGREYYGTHHTTPLYVDISVPQLK